MLLVLTEEIFTKFLLDMFSHNVTKVSPLKKESQSHATT